MASSARRGHTVRDPEIDHMREDFLQRAIGGHGQATDGSGCGRGQGSRARNDPWAAFAAFVVALTPRTAFAEVSDKFPTTSEHWIVALPVAACVLLATRWRWWLALPLALPLAAIVSTHAALSTTDRDLGDALLREQGWPYFLSLWGSDLHMVAALVCGGVLGWRRRSRAVPSVPGPPLEGT